MFERITPEQAGISSKIVTEFISNLERRGANMHSLVLIKDGKIFSENYWAPYKKGSLQRMYSQTKSFVAIAIGLLEEEGKLCLDDKIVDLFMDKIDGDIETEFLKEQTVRDMLTMTTVGLPGKWFTSGDPDRTHYYLNDYRTSHPSSTIFRYDSAGSQVLCSLVERLAKKPLLDYLKEKLFNKMECFKKASVLKTPNGDSWGDSALICTVEDMACFGQLLINGGVWNGERLINEKFVKDATSKLVDNRLNGNYSVYNQGYGYQIWRVEGNGFAFIGMGDQITLCYPEKNVMLVCTADNQGKNNLVREILIATFAEQVLANIGANPIAENIADYEKLENLSKSLKLRCAMGLSDSSFREELNDKTYICRDNPMGILNFKFKFNDQTSGEFYYQNAQGEKTIPFGINHNVFGKFPQFGYSNEYGAVKTTDGFVYDDAVSFAWLEEKKVMLYVQIIDKYLGNLSAVFAFKNDYVTAVFSRAAENFLKEYQGELVAQLKK